jgi:hypothetical protein
LPKKIQTLIVSFVRIEKIVDLFKQIWALSNKKKEFAKLFVFGRL